MHDLKALSQNTEFYRSKFKARNVDLSLIDEILSLNEERKRLIAIVEGARAEVNSVSKEIGKLKSQGQDAQVLMNKVSQLKTSMEGASKDLESTELRQNEILSGIPNITQDDVPVGPSSAENKEVRKWGQPKVFSFTPKDHADLGEALGMLNFEAAAKVSGARFCFSFGMLARLERAITNFFLDSHVNAGYTEVLPPFIVNAEAMYGTGNLPKFKEDLFKLEGLDWYLIPTSEVPLTNIPKGEILDGKKLPYLYTAYSPCFRSEAGSYGRDTKGLIRQHQFNKVELVNITAPDQSEEAHQKMVGRAEEVLQALGLPYRVMLLCTGDMGFSSSKTYDIEVWLPSQGKYREISSCSNCWDFQARRAGIRYRGSDGKPNYVHTLNGSGVAVGRAMLAIMENYQQADGSIIVPEVLVPYMGGAKIIKNTSTAQSEK